MNILEKKVDAMIRLLTSESVDDRKAARKEITHLMSASVTNAATNDLESTIRELLLEVGSPDHLIGHPYAVEAIQLVVGDRSYIEQITFKLYPAIAAKYDTTSARVERALRHLVEVTWDRSDIDTLNNYFGNIVAPNKGKPTNGEFIARCANIVQMRMKNVQK